MRKVLKWINEREAARKPHEAKLMPVLIQLENQHPVPMKDALLLLGIAAVKSPATLPAESHLMIRAWAVQSGVDRMRRPLNRRELEDLSEHVDEPNCIRWPKGFGDGR